MLDGEGTFQLWPTPQRSRGPGRVRGDPGSRRPRRSRDPRARASRTASAPAQPGLTYLAYGTRSPGDVCYYPRSNKIYFRGLGLIARLEDLDYDDGEPR